MLMGTRIVFEILGEIDDKPAPVCILFSNSSHATEDPETLFRALAAKAIGPTELAEQTITSRYKTSSGKHEAGERLFWISDTPYGDYDFILRASFPDGAVPLCQVEKIDQPEPEMARP
jgi:hypothetical protein